MPRKKTATKIGRIEDDTPILPYAVADSVINEVDRCVPLNMSIGEQRALVDKLADHADAVYSRNEGFRKKIRGHGDTGRDHLYAFMRHWLSAELKKSRPAVFDQLPQSFMSGEELYCGNLRPSFRASHATKKSAAQLNREIAEAIAPFEGMHVAVTKTGAKNYPGLVGRSRPGLRGWITRVASPDVRSGPATSRARVRVTFTDGSEYVTDWPTEALRVVT